MCYSGSALGFPFRIDERVVRLVPRVLLPRYDSNFVVVCEGSNSSTVQ